MKSNFVALLLAVTFGFVNLATLTLAADATSSVSVLASGTRTTGGLLPLNNLSQGMYGVALPRFQSTIVAQVSGMIVEQLVEEGAVVTAGQPLLVIDPRVALAFRDVAKSAAEKTATIRKAELDLELARSQYQHMTTAHKAKASTDSELFASRIQRDQAQATLENETQLQREAAKRLELAEAQLARHTIRAPFAGRVVRLATPLGANAIAATTELITVAVLQELEVEMYLPADQFGKIRTGESRTLIAEAPVNRHVTAYVKSVSPIIDPATRSLRCVFIIPNADEKLPSGFTVQLAVNP